MAAPVIAQAKSGSGSGINSLQVTFDSNVTSGNLLVVSGGLQGSASGALNTATVTSSPSLTWTLITSSIVGSYVPDCAAWYAYADSASAYAVTIDSTDGVAYAARLLEISGAASSTPFDDTDANATGWISAGDALDGPTLTTTAAETLLVSPYAGQGGTYTAGTNWTLSGSTLIPDAAQLSFAVLTRAVTSSGSYASSATSSANGWTEIVSVAIKAGGATADAVPVCWSQYRARRL